MRAKFTYIRALHVALLSYVCLAVMPTVVSLPIATRSLANKSPFLYSLNGAIYNSYGSDVKRTTSEENKRNSQEQSYDSNSSNRDNNHSKDSGLVKETTDPLLMLVKAGGSTLGHQTAVFSSRKRYERNAMHTIDAKTRVTVALNPIENFFPDYDMKTVCMSDSDDLEGFLQNNFLVPHVYRKKHKSRPFFTEMRYKMFDNFNSEECHKYMYNTWVAYVECALRRNQRMEAAIPHYPKVQEIDELIR